MLYDLSQPIFNNVPQWPKHRPTSLTLTNMAVVDAANVERVELTTHTGTHMDAPFHFFPEMETVDRLPLDYFHGPCIAVDLRPKRAASGIVPGDFTSLSRQNAKGAIILLKTGWGDKRALSEEFLTAWPYLTGDGAKYLVSLGIHGVGIEGLSVGGYNDPEKEQASHKVLLGNRKLVVEDIRVPEALLDGRVRHFAAFPILITGAGGAWARAIVWDEGDMF